MNMWNKRYDNLIYNRNTSCKRHHSTVWQMFLSNTNPLERSGNLSSRECVCTSGMNSVYFLHFNTVTHFEGSYSDEPVKHISDPQTSVPQHWFSMGSWAGNVLSSCVCVCEDIRPRACVWSAVCSGQRERTESERTSRLSWSVRAG